MAYKAQFGPHEVLVDGRWMAGTRERAMKFVNLRVRLYYRMVERVSEWTQRRRMQQMTRCMRLGPGMKVLDLGGLPGTWRDAPGPLQITVLNLPGTAMTPESGDHRFSYLEGNACHVEALRDGSFDMVFSNSVIEHVGAEDQQQAFAQEVRRLGESLLGADTGHLVSHRSAHRHAVLVVLPPVAATAFAAALAPDPA